jgi:Protein of unknown function (DUF2852)
MLNYALRPAFTPLTLLLMVLGFVFFWPLGLAMLAYMVWGHRVPEIQRHFADAKSNWTRDWDCGPGWGRNARWGSRGFTRSGNAAFDDYRERELKRLEEERRRLDEDLRDFEGYMNDLRRARDQEEFDRYMRERPNRKPRNEGTSGGDGDNRPRVDL